jgi:hypothetical protein
MSHLRRVKNRVRIDLFSADGMNFAGSIREGEIFTFVRSQRAPEEWLAGLSWYDDPEGDMACLIISPQGATAWAWWMFVRDRSDPL